MKSVHRIFEKAKADGNKSVMMTVQVLDQFKDTFRDLSKLRIVPQKKVVKTLASGKQKTEVQMAFDEDELIACGRDLDLAKNDMTGDIDVVGTAPIPVSSPMEAAKILQRAFEFQKQLESIPREASEKCYLNTFARLNLFYKHDINSTIYFVDLASPYKRGEQKKRDNMVIESGIQSL